MKREEVLMWLIVYGRDWVLANDMYQEQNVMWHKLTQYLDAEHIEVTMRTDGVGVQVRLTPKALQLLENDREE